MAFVGGASMKLNVTVDTHMKCSAEQLAAIQSSEDSIICLSGPGSGKSAVLIERVNALLASGQAPERIVVLAFTNASAGELVARLYAGPYEALAQRLGYVGTRHGFINRMLAMDRYRAAVGLSQAPTIIDDEAAEQIMESVKGRLGYKGTKAALHDAFKVYPARSEPPTPAELVVSEYRGTLRRMAMLDYDTLLQMGKELVANVHLPFDHVLTDEVQDSSRIDWFIDERIAAKRFMVGDDSQAIFGFRGGKVDALLERCHDESWTVYTLETNYRSDVMICDAANRLIAHNKGRVPKTIKPASKERGEVKALVLSSRVSEYTIALNHIGQWRREGFTVAVLLRMNAQVDSWHQLLAEAKYPAQRREARVYPADWQRAKLLLAVFANPQHDEIMCQYLKAVGHSATEIAARRLKAAKTGITVAKEWGLNVSNGHFTPHYIFDMLQAHLISEESAGLARATAEHLPAKATMGDLLVALNADDRRSMTGDPEGVHVLTLHSAKGLEFDCVVLPETDESASSERVLNEEERRLFFVGMTRARHRLLVTGALEGKGRNGQSEKRKPLSFIKEMLG
jgi:DNA helicase-2/ATP-dependent DNA helicase PcrA